MKIRLWRWTIFVSKRPPRLFGAKTVHVSEMIFERRYSGVAAADRTFIDDGEIVATVGARGPLEIAEFRLWVSFEQLLLRIASEFEAGERRRGGHSL
jgi:hypothetical protein